MSALKRLGVSAEVVDKLQRKYSLKQKQTEKTFEFKWSKRDTYDSEAVKRNHQKWLFERYCENAELAIEHINIQNSGITIVARKL